MSLELELWAMNSARISALEEGGGGGGSTSNLCIRVPKFCMDNVADEDTMVIEMDEETLLGWQASFTVPDDGRPYYAVTFANIGLGIGAGAIIIESAGGEMLSCDELMIVDTSAEEMSKVIYHLSKQSGFQNEFYSPLRTEEQKSAICYSLAFDNSSMLNNHILLKNGVEYVFKYDKYVDSSVIEDTEEREAFEELQDYLAMSNMLYIIPGTYEEIPVVVRNGGNT